MPPWPGMLETFVHIAVRLHILMLYCPQERMHLVERRDVRLCQKAA